MDSGWDFSSSVSAVCWVGDIFLIFPFVLLVSMSLAGSLIAPSGESFDLTCIISSVVMYSRTSSSGEAKRLNCSVSNIRKNTWNFWFRLVLYWRTYQQIQPCCLLESILGVWPGTKFLLWSGLVEVGRWFSSKEWFHWAFEVLVVRLQLGLNHCQLILEGSKILIHIFGRTTAFPDLFEQNPTT